MIECEECSEHTGRFAFDAVPRGRYALVALTKSSQVGVTAVEVDSNAVAEVEVLVGDSVPLDISNSLDSESLRVRMMDQQDQCVGMATIGRHDTIKELLPMEIIRIERWTDGRWVLQKTLDLSSGQPQIIIVP